MGVADQKEVASVTSPERKPTGGADGGRSRNVSRKRVTSPTRSRNVVQPNHSRVTSGAVSRIPAFLRARDGTAGAAPDRRHGGREGGGAGACDEKEKRAPLHLAFGDLPARRVGPARYRRDREARPATDGRVEEHMPCR